MLHITDYLSKTFKSLKESGLNLKKEKTRVYLSRQ